MTDNVRLTGRREVFVAFCNEFVNVCLDFSIAQYMEDSSLSEHTKRILLIRIRKQNKTNSQTY